MGLGKPPRLEILLYDMAGVLAPSVWRDWVDRFGLRGDERVLEFGAGAGIAARFIAQRLQSGGGHLTCTDVSNVWLEVARRRLRKYPNVEFRLGDIDTLNLPDAAFDVIDVHFVLHEVPPHDRARVLTVLRHKLEPGGRLFLREPLRESLHPMSEGEIRRCTRQACLIERESRIARVLLQGVTFEGVFGRAPAV